MRTTICLKSRCDFSEDFSEDFGATILKTAHLNRINQTQVLRQLRRTPAITLCIKIVSPYLTIRLGKRPSQRNRSRSLKTAPIFSAKGEHTSELISLSELV